MIKTSLENSIRVLRRSGFEVEVVPFSVNSEQYHIIGVSDIHEGTCLFPYQNMQWFQTYDRVVIDPGIIGEEGIIKD